MKKTKIILLAIALPLVAWAQETEDTEVLTEIGFENMTVDKSIVVSTDPFGSTLLNKWSLVLKNNSRGEGIVTTEDKHTGKQALKIVLENIDYRYRFFLAQEVENLAPAEYTFSLWLKADVNDIPFRIDLTGGNNDIDLFKKELRTVANEWTQYNFDIDLTSYSANDLKVVRFAIRPNCYNGGSVINTPITYYVDDISCIGQNLPETVLFEPQPYLQSKTQTSIVVNWFSAAGEEGTPVVEYGTNDLSNTASGNMKTVSNTVWSEVALKNLLPDTEYQYRCRVGENVSATYHFRTLPPDDTTRKIRFLSFGDSHEASTTLTVRKSALAKLQELYGDDIHNHIDFVVCTGDVVASYGQIASEFSTIHFTPNEALSCMLPYNISAGNHDFEKNDSEHSYFYDYMNFTPLSDVNGDAKGKYYAQQVGNALFIYLNSNKQYLCELTESNANYQANCEAQLNWLADKLSAAETDDSVAMIFIFLHHGYRYEMWSDPTQNATAHKIKDRLYPIMNLSTKIKAMQYGHTHAVECGILNLENGNSLALFLNGNAGSYPDYFGRYDTYVNFPEIYRAMEHTGFAITEIDPTIPAYTTTYYAVMQRRVVEGGSSTSIIRNYSPASPLVQWGYDASRPIPEAPEISHITIADGIMEIKTVLPENAVSVNYRIEGDAGELLVDSILNFEDVFGNTGYVAGADGTLDLEQAYLPLDLNKDIEMDHFCWPFSGTVYTLKVRWRDDNFTWSDYSIRSSNTTSCNSVAADRYIIRKIGGTIEITAPSDFTVELYMITGNVLQRASAINGQSVLDVSALDGVHIIRLCDAQGSHAKKIVL